MQDIFFTDPSEAPVPPEELRIRELEAEPRADGRRVSVRTAMTPFQQRPNLELTITNAAGHQVASLNVVEAIDPVMEFTMHLREAHTGGDYTLSMRAFYVALDELQETDADGAGDFLDKTAQTVDTRELTFTVPRPASN